MLEMSVDDEVMEVELMVVFDVMSRSVLFVWSLDIYFMCVGHRLTLRGMQHSGKWHEWGGLSA